MNILTKLGFREIEAQLITKNLIEAELVEKHTHGLIRLPAIVANVSSGKIAVTTDDIELISERKAALHFNGNYKPGWYGMYRSLEQAIAKVKESGVVAVAVKDLAYATGYIGDYARIATQNDLIFIGFHNSPGGLVPFGTTKSIWGTNPVTIGVPTHQIPVILDMASSQITWGELMLAKNEGKMITQGVAIDSEGNATIDPVQAMTGGILPIAGHKGSGLAFIVELLAGGLSNSRVGEIVDGGWGSFYMLIDPVVFRNIDDFKNDVEKAIRELKNAPKMPGIREVYFPGEQSFLKRQQNLSKDIITISDTLLDKLKKFILT